MGNRVLIKLPASQKPPGIRQFNREHPHLRGCLGWWTLSEAGDLKNRIFQDEITTVGAPSFSPNRFGPGFSYDGVDDAHSLHQDCRYEVTPYTWMIDFEMLDVTGYQAILVWCDGSGGTYNWGELRSNGTALEFKGSGSGVDATASGLLATGNLYRIFITVDGTSGANCAIYGGAFPGSFTQLATGVGNVSLNSTCARVTAMQVAARDSALEGHIRAYQVRIYDRMLAEAEMRDIFYKPYAPIEEKVFVQIPSVAGVTVSPGLGKAAFSGKTPTVVAQKIARPTTGTALFSGKASTVVTEVVATVQPTTGTAIFSGLAPTIVTAGATVAPTTGTALFSGLAPTTFREVTVSPTTGKITYAGVTPSAASSSTPSPTTGTALLSGLAPTITRQKDVFPGAGAALFQGQTPALFSFVNLTPTTGTALFSGKAPSAGPFIGVTVSPTLGKALFSGKSLTAEKTAVFGQWNPIDEVSSSWIPYTRVSDTWTDL